MKNIFESRMYDEPTRYVPVSKYSSSYGAKSSGGVEWDWNQLVVQPLEQITHDIVKFLPEVIIAVFTLMLGWLLARITGAIVSKFLKSIGFDKFVDNIGLSSVIGSGENKILPHQFFGQLTFWSIMFFTVINALRRLDLYFTSSRLNEFFFLFTTVFIVLIIILIGIFLSFLSGRIVQTVSEKLKIKEAVLYGNITRWTVLIFTFLMCLFQIGMPLEIVLIVLGVAYLSICITFIIAFGGGGVGWAAKVLNKLLKEK